MEVLISLPDGYEAVKQIIDKSRTKLSAMFLGGKNTINPILGDTNQLGGLERLRKASCLTLIYGM